MSTTSPQTPSQTPFDPGEPLEATVMSDGNSSEEEKEPTPEKEEGLADWGRGEGFKRTGKVFIHLIGKNVTTFNINE
jgi:hypothetical protein